MLIVDSQVHIWKDVLLNKLHRQVETFSKDDLLAEMKAAEVDAVLLHPPGTWSGGMAMAEEAAVTHPERFAVLGYFDLGAGPQPDIVAHWQERPGEVGLRFNFNAEHMRSWPTDGTVDWVWPEIEKAGIPVGLLAHEFLPRCAWIAENHPGMRILIDHMGVVPTKKDNEAFATLPDLLALAKFPNVGVKLSGAPSNSSDVYPYRNIHDHMRRIFDAFGPERCFWGTDLSRMPCSYRECVTMFTEALPWLTGCDLELVMGEALCNWVGWHPRGVD